MRRFAALYDRLDRTTSTNAKAAAIQDYFRDAPPEDAAWGLYFLAGEKLKRLVPVKRLRAWCTAQTGVSESLFAASYQHVGDLAETITLLIDAAAPRDPEPPRPSEPDAGLRAWVEDRLLTLRGMPEHEQRSRVVAWWSSLRRGERFLLIKMLTGALRIGVTRTLVERALSPMAGVSQATISHRLMGEWKPTPAFLERLLAPENAPSDAHQHGGFARPDPGTPYPFFLASPAAPPELPADFEGTQTDWIERELGDPAGWHAEWKWDGIRAQVIKRAGQVFLWSRGDENLTERFPEVVDAAARLPDGTVLDGELLCWQSGRATPMSFGVLQRRIGRKKLPPDILRDAPATLAVYDALEIDARDIRHEPIERRTGAIDGLLAPGSAALRRSNPIEFDTWARLADLRAQSRERGVEGVMLKRRASTYQAGRRRGDWWKWKIDPLTLDAVLVYAEPGHGRRANLLTDYTFAVWNDRPESNPSNHVPSQGLDQVSSQGRELMTVTKAYSGLSDQEFEELDRWIRAHTLDRYGPVRAVEPAQVFELSFEGVRRSTRHKSGVAFRFPRMRRWRKDKPAEEADTFSLVWSMIGSDGHPDTTNNNADPR